ncbi:MAG TPA: Yip1 family protein [Giesbergeria sp.]|nr:Yip1 family protein [Giesbergeria sp.]HNE70694.1 Yip1 family protein [Giesbergeria sp.]HNI75106.1 Yip1 family protein [Giesbergeria sp.]HNK05311.1 Yip1 family protein [Giesbergeria sp.]HNM38758.1 Yip1 family protein [Giesbergeria sp.]
MNTSPLASTDRAALLQRVLDILMRPRETWLQINAEDGNPGRIYLGYLVFLAAIPAVAGFIGYSLIGVGAFGISVRVPVVQGLVSMVVGYVLSLAMVYVLALIANMLAPRFQAQQDMGSAFKLVAYASTAGMLGGVFSILPSLAMLGLLAALYSVYLLYTGIPVLMKAPQEKAVGYTAALVVCGILAGIVVGLATSLVTPGARGLGAGMAGMGDTGSVTMKVPGTDIKIDTGRLEEASRKMEEAQAKGDTQAAAKAATEMMGAALGGKGGEPFAPKLLRDTLPERVGDLPRTAIEARSESAMGMQFTHVSAQYTHEDKELEIQIQDLGAVPALRMAMAGWATTTAESENADEVERIYRQGDTTIKESYRKDGSSADVALMLPNGVMVQAYGRLPVEDLKRHLLPLGQKLGALRRAS